MRRIVAEMRRFVAVAGVFSVAVGLTFLFWEPLFSGGGFVGGDVYSYYLPQKAFYADRLHAGEFPLWNNRVGHGYPLVGESQTGPFYPFHLLLYSTLDVGRAYHVNHLLHYLLIFLFTVLFARSIGLSYGAAMLASAVFVYGWFPPRSCLEWAVITGTWMPLALWCVERFLQTRFWRYAVGLSATLGVQMLAGHFHLAFITQLLVLVYFPVRLWGRCLWGRHQTADLTGGDAGGGDAGGGKCRVAVVVLAAVVCGFGIAAVQLWPTAALKQHSQRDTAGKDHHLIQGSLPVGYWSQLVRPWYWYSLQRDRGAKLNEMTGRLDAGTNQVEAHLYFGLLPFGLMLVGLVIGVREGDGVVWFWTCAGLMALSYTPGWWLPVTGSLPGFAFFQGPGRFGVVTTLAAGILAGRGLDGLLKMRASRSIPVALLLLLIATAGSWVLVAESVDVLRQLKRSPPFPFVGMNVDDWHVLAVASVAVAMLFAAWVMSSRQLRTESALPAIANRLVIVAVLTMSVFDFWIVSRLVKESEMMADSPIDHLDESPLAKFIARQEQPLRLLAPAANFPTVFAAASTPVYLTFGPKEYFDSRLQMPTDSPTTHFHWLQWLRRAGVTHVLCETRRETPNAEMTLVWQGTDPVFNRAMARGGKPLFLYQLNNDKINRDKINRDKINGDKLESDKLNNAPARRGRVAWEGGDQTGTARVTDYAANHVRICTVSKREDRLVLTDLFDPDWSVRVDGKSATPLRIDGMFRGVKVPSGEHTVTWNYRPRSVYWGAALSVFTFILLAGIAHIKFWHPHRCRFIQLERAEKNQP